jgi:galactose-1-phosphate uridylyltransferase
MGRISFESRREAVEFHNPLEEGRLDRQEIEVRLDPLTGRQSILSDALKGKVSVLFPETDYEYMRRRIEDTRPGCFLCDGKWRGSTPRYPESLLPGGRIARGEIVLFPNLYPLAPYHAVVMVGEKHGRTADEFSPELLHGAFSVSLEFIKRCFEYDPQARYFTINANFMPPAGGSAVHPHLQVLGSAHPMTHHRLLLDKSLAYYRASGSCYWLDLLETEREAGERWLGEIGPSRWFAAFSPMGVNEVNAVWPKASHFLEWDGDDARALAEGVHRTLAAFHELKFSTFNYSCYSGPLEAPASPGSTKANDSPGGISTPEFRCFLRLVNRQNMNLHYRSDDYFLQKLLENEIIIHPPERLASFLRERFRPPAPL